MLSNRCDMLGIFAAMQNPAMDFGMERLHAAIEHFRKPGELGNVFHCDAGFAEEFGGTPGGDEFDAESRKLAGEIDESGFVSNAEDGTADFRRSAGHDRPREQG